MRTPAEIWAKLSEFVKDRDNDEPSGDPKNFFFINKFLAEFQSMTNEEIEKAYLKLFEKKDDFINKPDYITPDYCLNPRCPCHQIDLEKYRVKPTIKNWFGEYDHNKMQKDLSDSRDLAYYDHNNLFKCILLAEIMGEPDLMTNTYYNYLDKIVITKMSSREDAIKIANSLLKYLFNFLISIENMELLNNIAVKFVEISPKEVYYYCRTGLITSPSTTKFVKKQWLVLEGVIKVKNHLELFHDGQTDHELQTLIDEQEKHLVQKR